MVERLHVSPFKRKTLVRFPELAPTYHSSFHLIVYIHCIHDRPSDGDEKKSVPCISFLSSMHDKYVIIITYIAYIELKGRKTAIPPPASIGAI